MARLPAIIAYLEDFYPCRKDAADVVEGIQHDLGRSNSKGKERAIEHDEEVHPNRLEGRMGEEDERYRSTDQLLQ